MPIGLVREGSQEHAQSLRRARHHDNARNSGRGVGMDLERRIPKMLGMTVQAGEESGVGRVRRNCKGQRECHLDRASIRAPSLSIELIEIEITNAGIAEFRRIGRTTAFEYQQ